MILRNYYNWQDNYWKKLLSESFSCLKDLLEYLQINIEENNPLFDNKPSFKLMVPRGFAALMEKNNLKDPLLLQALPLSLENKVVHGFRADPLQEKLYNPLPGVLHKYKSRILIILGSACAINCRYCFRRTFDYSANKIPVNEDLIVNYINSHPDINEVILSGGDPFLFSDKPLLRLLSLLDNVTQITRIRFHTRIPIVLPQRFTRTLITGLSKIQKKLIIVIHCNHPHELSQESNTVLQTLAAIPITLLNQAVLLKDINNDVDTLAKLQEHLFANGVLPYYVHILDKVSGTAHFYVSEHEGKELIKRLSVSLPGFLVPKLAKEIPGFKHKVVLN